MKLLGLLFVVSGCLVSCVARSLLSWLTGSSAGSSGPLDTGRLAMYLNTQQNPNKAEALDVKNPAATVRNSNFRASKPVVVLIHGYSDLYSRSWWSDMVTELLQADDLNVFRLDWSVGNRPPYSKATSNAVEVGEYLANFLLKLVQAGVNPDDIYLVGHSLGCHLAGYAGKAFKKSGSQIGRITGLDPAGPSFSNSAIASRLHSTDAKYVDTIVTDSGNYGSATKMGQLNFYPNGGSKQPGCRQGFALYNCNHARALGLFTESINNKACTMTGQFCDSYEQFLQGGCNQGRTDTSTPMGYHANVRIADKSRGTISFYVTTGSKSPFCRI